MPALSWPGIRNRATRFAKEWRDATSGQAEGQISIASNLNLYVSKCRLIRVPRRAPNATLAQLYDPNSMPANLVKAHEKVDRAVDAYTFPMAALKLTRATLSA